MKQCPACKNTYSDDSLTFCLSDGTPLINYYDPQATQAFPTGSTQPNHGRVNIPIGNQATGSIGGQTAGESMVTKIGSLPVQPVHVQPTPAARRGCSPILVVALVLILGFLGVAGIVGAYFASKSDLFAGNNPQPRTATPTPASSPTPAASNSPNLTNSNTVSNEQALKDKLDQLQKQLDDQKKAANKTANNTTPPPPPSGSSRTAHVNSPGDGFLAMRSSPSSQSGYQVMKIPHGAAVSVYGCQNPTTIGGKTGRWCVVSYGGYSGWAFDAWLIY